MPCLAVPSLSALLPVALSLPAPFQSLLEFFEKGGLFMVPLAVCSLTAVAITLLRAMALRRTEVMPRVLVDQIEQLTPAGDPALVARLAAKDPSTLGRLVRVGANHLRWPKVDNVEAVQSAAKREVLRLESGLNVLELIVGISPLLGLLGAVAGLVKVFSNLGSGKIAADTLGVALGIAEALNTTIFGLGIAILTLVAYTFFTKRVEKLSVEMESLLSEFLAKCYYQGAGPARPAASRPASSGWTTEADPVTAGASSVALAPGAAATTGRGGREHEFAPPDHREGAVENGLPAASV